LLFALSFLPSMERGQLALLVGVLLFHELGHFVGMRLFGYRNVRMFFIPFFGAAASGTKQAAPAWQRVVVLLLGPLPGIFLGLLQMLALRPTFDTVLGMLVVFLVAVNAFNLLPVVPLDGGRIFDVLLLQGRPILAALFWAAAALAIGALA